MGAILIHTTIVFPLQLTQFKKENLSQACPYPQVNFLLKLSSQWLLHCIKLTININHYTGESWMWYLVASRMLPISG